MRKPLSLIALIIALSFPLIPPCASADVLLESGGQPLRVRFVGDGTSGYDVLFEVRSAGGWDTAARFPDGRAWTVFTAWRDSWYADGQGVKVGDVRVLPGGKVRATATAVVGGQPWSFMDDYALENGLVCIDRSFAHLGTGVQGTITLESRVRLPLGSDRRMLMPGILYNNNPGSTLVGTKVPEGPGGLGLYEEHRLPIPMVNVESRLRPGDGPAGRLSGSLVAAPSTILQGRKAGDHWWSLGLEYGDGFVDLLSVSGPVATNGKKSQVYGHRNGFDPYDDAYVVARGPVVFRKTLYLDLAAGVRAGYGFRETLWKAYDVFRPTSTPHPPYAEAMTLVSEYAKTRFYRGAAVPGTRKKAERPAGFTWFPNTGPADKGVWKFQYAWCGGILGIAYGLLEYADRAGDAEAREQALDSIRFFIENADAGAPGLYFGDYHLHDNTWVLAEFHQSAWGISSRQLGENLEHLASLVELGRRLRLPQSETWLAALRKGGDFLLRSPRHKGLLPRAWTPDGKALGWPATGDPAPGDISTAGVQCVCGLARLASFTGERKYLDAARDIMDAYWREFGETLETPFWGATIDAGAEDKEAGWGMLRAALDVHAVTLDPKYLAMARDAADWTLTWMYFHKVPFKPESGLLHQHVNTVGWTFISTQNQEIDVYGAFIAPDLFRLGQACGDDRYKRLGRVVFEAATQTISRPGAMFGPAPGVQAEHYNHSNCTYVTGGPEMWRGAQLAMGIAWTMAGTLYGGSRLHDLDPWEFPAGPAAAPRPPLRYDFARRAITVDGDPADWAGVEENVVEGADHLWLGQGMTLDKWKGDKDLSFRWRGAWDGEQLSFLIVVADDRVVDPPAQPKTWLNDSIEIHLDPRHLRGPRKETVDGTTRLRGYEMQFLPVSKPVIVLDDVLSPTYPQDRPQNDIFENEWKGRMAVKRTRTGYVAEISFTPPGVRLEPGATMGVDVAVGDDDGSSRKALQIWSGNRGEFWVNMDDHPVITLR